MFPLWEVAVAPVLEAAEARRLVEIGALRGENTRQIIERLGPQTELHVIDPLPDFDPEIHEKEFAGQYIFHRDLSLNVLGDLPPVDAALIDGDHNWYTVYNELRLLREVARSHDAPLPVMLLHDVGWPYGRRDLYYDPSNIPEEFRRDWKRSGLEPGKVRVVPYGAGLNPTLANAKVEGGARNGVMTAVDDFVAEHDRPLRVVVLPVYFGLAIVVETERLERQPALAAELDRLESPAGKDQLLDLAEDVRLQALIFQHKIFYDRERTTRRLARRYLGQVQAGPVGEDSEPGSLDLIGSCLDTVGEDIVRGDVVTWGVQRTGPTAFAKAYLEAYSLTGRHLWVITEPEAALAAVRESVQRLDLVNDRTHELASTGTVDESALPERVALLYVGAGTGSDPAALLDSLYRRLSHGGFVIFDRSVGDDMEAALAELRDRWGDAVDDDRFGPDLGGWRKTEEGRPVPGPQMDSVAEAGGVQS